MILEAFQNPEVFLEFMSFPEDFRFSRCFREVSGTFQVCLRGLGGKPVLKGGVLVIKLKPSNN